MSPEPSHYEKAKALEDAVTAALPGDTEAYFFDPLLIMHTNGKCYGVLGSANAGLAWQAGLSERSRQFFYLVNVAGELVTIADNPRAPGHAYAIMAKLGRRS